MIEDSRPIMISIWCITYNQEPYIRQCLEGFVMQKTDFRFEAIVHDDASTDGTAAIVREYAEQYPEIIKPILECENQWSKHDDSLDRIMREACKGKYIAFCEGDDYWIDPQKLQKEFYILESNPSVTLVYSSFKTVDEYGREINRPFFEEIKKQSRSGEVLDMLLRGNFIMTLTVCLRRFLIESELYLNCPISLDLSLALAAAMYGDVFYLPENTGCYRKVGTSMTNSHHKVVLESSNTIREYYAEKYIDKHYKVINYLDDRKILYMISNICITDRNWSLIKRAYKRPYFLAIFLITLLSRGFRKLFKAI